MTGVMGYEAAAARLGVTPRSVRRLVRLGHLPAVPMGTHRNGRVAYGIPAEAVEARPASARTASSVGAGLKPAPTALAVVPTALPAARRASVRDRVPLTHDGIPDVAAMREIGLGTHADEWDRRMRIVSDLRTARVRWGHGEAVARMVAEKYSVHLDTVYQWDRDLRLGGPVALVPAWRGNVQTTTLPADLQLQVREYWLNSRQATFRQTYRDVVLPWYAERDEDPPHYKTLCRYLRKHVLPLEAVYRREGRAAYQATVAPKVVRALPDAPNDWWCADHRLWDVMVVVPDGHGAGWGRHDRIKCPCGSGRERRECCSLRRPWVTMIADVTTAGWMGWRIGLTPNAAGVCHAVRSAIMAWGLPKNWLRDNGREFCATRLGGKAERLLRPRKVDLEGQATWPCALPLDVETSGVWAALGVSVTSALPYSAWSKPIESYFAAWSKQWENLVPGWCGRDAQQKPEQLESQIRNGALLFEDQFRAVFAREAAKWNEEHVCGDRTAPPAALVKEYVQGGGDIRRMEPAALNYLLQDRREIRVTTKGIELRAGGDVHRYYSPEIALYVGCDVKIRWDPEDAAEICVYAPGGKVMSLPRAETAKWGEFGAANLAAKQGGKLQRAYLAARADEMRGATPPERLDPTGAVALIGERQAEIAARTDAEERVAALADEQAVAVIAARAAAKEEPRRTETVYDQDLRGIA